MGMDVFGKAPKGKEGKYFRANLWSWRPIQVLMHIANLRNGGRLISTRVMCHLGRNDGEGLKDQGSCDRLADALDWLLAHPAAIREHGMDVGKDDEGEFIGISASDSPLLCDSQGHLHTEEDARKKGIALKSLRSAYQTPLSHVREFITFLRNCGGFEVW